MLILSIRTDKPESEIALSKDYDLLSQTVWQAHRTLADTILLKIENLLKEHSQDLKYIQGIICFIGPGSFTGLRIGITVANTLAQSLNIPVVGGSGESWREEGTTKLLDGKDDKIILPIYGSEAKTTKPKK